MYSFLILALDGNECSLSHHSVLMFREITPDSHSVLGWMAPTAQLDALGKKKISCPLADSIFIFSHAYSFIHSIGMCQMRRFLAILRSFFLSSLLCTFSCHPSPPTILPSFLTSSCHLFLGLPLSLVVPKFIYNTLLGILFSSVLCTCPNQHNLFNFTVL